MHLILPLRRRRGEDGGNHCLDYLSQNALFLQSVDCHGLSLNLLLVVLIISLASTFASLMFYCQPVKRFCGHVALLSPLRYSHVAFSKLSIVGNLGERNMIAHATKFHEVAIVIFSPHFLTSSEHAPAVTYNRTC